MVTKKYHFPDWFIEEIVDSSVKERAKNGDILGQESVEFQCPKGHFYKRKVFRRIKLSSMESLKGCPICARKQGANLRKKNIISQHIFPEWFINELANDEDKLRARKAEISSREKLEFVCKEGHHYIQRISDHICITNMQPKYGCPQCGTKNRISARRLTLEKNRFFPEWFLNDLVNEKDKENAVLGKLSSEDVIQFYCSKGHKYKQRVGDHITLSTRLPKYGCPQCAEEHKAELTKEQKYKERPEYPQWFINQLIDETDIEKARNKTLIVTDIVTVKCPLGHIYKSTVSSIIAIKTSEQLKQCPICYNNTHRSKSELFLENYIKELGFNVLHSKKILDSNQELDIYIPEKNIAIEYNGSYFHRTLPEDIGICARNKMYHRNKFLECKNKGIHLLSIFDVDFNNKKQKILDYINSLLRKVENVYARKCVIQKINKEQANSMYNQYHLLGTTPIIDVSYGLFYNGELLSCMSFQKGRYKENKNPVWTLTRFVTKSGYSIIGGASKLLKQFEREYNPRVILSYSDNDYFSGNVYKKLGFSCLGDTNSPRYYWFLNNKEIKREQCQLKSLSKKYPELHKESLNYSGNKEDYIMLKLGALKVYRSGNTKWIKTTE